MYGIYREVLDSSLQHSGTHLQYCPCSPQICESHSGQENRQAGRQMDCRYLQTRPCHWKLYPTGRYSPAAGLSALSLETYQFYHWREKPCAKLPDCLQLQTGRRVLRCVRQGRLCNYHSNPEQPGRENHGCFQLPHQGNESY